MRIVAFQGRFHLLERPAIPIFFTLVHATYPIVSVLSTADAGLAIPPISAYNDAEGPVAAVQPFTFGKPMQPHDEAGTACRRGSRGALLAALELRASRC